MKKILLIIMIINMNIIAQAQNIEQKLISNPDITWIGESKIQISFENEDSFTDTFEDNKLFSSSVMKYSEEVMYELQYTGHFLSNRINEILDKDLTKPSGKNIDEVKSYYWYDLTLLWYYDQKTKKMESLLQSITPLIEKGKTFNEKKNEESILIPMKQKEITNLSIEDSEVIWAKLSSIQAYDFSKMKVLKGNTKEALKIDLLTLDNHKNS